MQETLVKALPRLIEEGRAHARHCVEQARRIGAPGWGNEWVTGTLTEVPATPSRLVHGDNLAVLSAGVAEQLAGAEPGGIDLIYADPPYESGVDYRARVMLPGLPGHAAHTLQPRAFSDCWPGGTAEYLSALIPRLVLMRELLSQRGSLCLHLDSRVAHYVKLVLDDIFGRDRLVNELIWQRTSVQSNARRFGHVHDVIYWYAKADEPYWQPTYEPLSPRHVVANYVFRDARGVYKLADLTGRGPGPARLFGERGVVEPMGGRHWPSQSTIDRLLAADGIHWTRAGRPYRKRYLQAIAGKPLQSIWSDVKSFRGAAAESLGYPTQKPEKLLARLIEAASPPGGVVADFYAGSGTTAAVAERLGRRWLCVDQGRIACAMTRQRLRAQGARPFLWQAGTSAAESNHASAATAPGSDPVVHLQTHPPVLVRAGESDDGAAPVLRVVLRRYTVASPNQLDLGEADLRAVMGHLAGNGLSLIDWWAVGLAEDGVFRPLWQSGRPAGLHTGPHQKALQTSAEIPWPSRSAPSRLYIRTTDVLGHDWQGSVDVPVTSAGGTCAAAADTTPY